MGLKDFFNARQKLTMLQTTVQGGSQTAHFDYDSQVCPVGLSSTVLLKI